NISPTLVADEGVRFRVEPGTLSAGRKRKPGNRYSYPETSALSASGIAPRSEAGLTRRGDRRKNLVSVGRRSDERSEERHDCLRARDSSVEQGVEDRRSLQDVGGRRDDTNDVGENGR